MELSKYQFADQTKEAFFEILTIIKYENDKEVLILKVLKKIERSMIADLVATLSKEEQARALELVKNQDKNFLIEFTKWFTEAQMKNIFLKKFHTTVQDLISNLGTSLTDEEKKTISEILQKPELKAE